MPWFWQPARATLSPHVCGRLALKDAQTSPAVPMKIFASFPTNLEFMIVYGDLLSVVITVDRHVDTGRLNSLSTPITNEKQHLWVLLKSGIFDGFWQPTANALTHLFATLVPLLCRPLAPLVPPWTTTSRPW